MSEKTTNFGWGYIYILSCCLTNAISLVFISHLNKTHNEMLSIFMTFGYATIIFNLINIKKIPALYGSVFRNKKVLFQMNFFTLLNWLSTFMSLRYLDPATMICINLGILSITIFLISTPLSKLKENKHLGFSVLLVLFSMGLIIQQHINTMPQVDLAMIVPGVLWCVLGGVTGAFIGLSSEAMGRAQFSITEILATRFYLLTFVGGIAFIFVHPTAIVIDWKYYFLASFVIVFFPLLMYQAAIRELGTLIVSLLEPFSPVVTYVLQVVIGDYRFNMLTIALLTLACMAMVWFMRVEQNIKRAKAVMA